MHGFVRRFQAAGILPESEAAEFFEGYERVAGAYPRDRSEMVSCHNDLKPENILFDGERVWLVDWEAGFLNDRYVDLAVVANFVVTDDGDEQAYLRTYFGEEAGEYRLARFYLMRQLLHVFFPAVFLMVSSGGKPVEFRGEAPGFREFHDGIWAGEVSLAAKEAKVEYARVHMNRFLENMRGARVREAMLVVAGR